MRIYPDPGSDPTCPQAQAPTENGIRVLDKSKGKKTPLRTAPPKGELGNRSAHVAAE